MNNQNKLEELIAEYRELDNKIEILETQKKKLREQLIAILNQKQTKFFQFSTDDELTILELKTNNIVNYDENQLRQRLEDKYRLIVKPDLKKIKMHLDELGAVLEPYLETIGSPDQDTVREKIESGELTVADFKGTFKKNIKQTLYVRRKKLQPKNQNNRRI